MTSRLSLAPTVRELSGVRGLVYFDILNIECAGCKKIYLISLGSVLCHAYCYSLPCQLSSLVCLKVEQLRALKGAGRSLCLAISHRPQMSYTRRPTSPALGRRQLHPLASEALDRHGRSRLASGTETSTSGHWSCRSPPRYVDGLLIEETLGVLRRGDVVDVAPLAREWRPRGVNLRRTIYGYEAVLGASWVVRLQQE